MKILVVTEQRQNKWNNTSFETLAAAQHIAKDTSSTISALVIGKGVASLADELASKNVAEVLLVENDPGIVDRLDGSDEREVANPIEHTQACLGNAGAGGSLDGRAD